MPLPSPSERFHANHAVVIAVDDYRDGIPRLRNAVRDAIAVGLVLGVQQGFSVQALFDGDATCTSVRTLLADLPSRIGNIDNKERVCIYIACHGLLLEDRDGDRPKGYLLLHDAKRDRSDTYLPMRELYDSLASVKALHFLLVLDCCFAGAFRWATYRDVRVPRTVFIETYDRFVTSSARQVLTSAASDQRAFDAFGDRGGDALHSPFAIALLRGLGARPSGTIVPGIDRGADLDGDDKGADLDGDDKGADLDG